MSGLDFAFGHLDDILVYRPDSEAHLKHLEIVFQYLLKRNLNVKVIKCKFLKKHLRYFGHLITETGTEPLPERLHSLQDMPPPTKLKYV